MEFGYLEENNEDSSDKKLRRLEYLKELRYGKRLEPLHINFTDKSNKERLEEKAKRVEVKRQQLLKLVAKYNAISR